MEDLSRIADADRGASLKRRIRQEAEHRFDLLHGPVLRIRLLRCTEEEHALTIVLHHIVADGWSIGVFAGELGALYQAFWRGDQSPLQPLPVRYRDFSAWQRTAMPRDQLQQGVDYWRSQLSDLAVLELPTDRRRPAVPVPAQGGRYPLRFGAEVVQQLRALADSEGATLAMAAVASLQAVLARYSGQRDIAVGMPVANRNLSELEGLIGFFVNMLVIRTDFSGRPSFRQLLRQVRQTALCAYEWQQIPFQLLVDELNPERVPNRHPLFQVSLAFQNVPQIELELPELHVTRLSDDENSRFDIEVFLGEQDGTLAGSIAFDKRLFNAETIASMAGHWVQLLSAAVQFPDAPIAGLAMLNPEQTADVIKVCNATEVAFAVDPLGAQLALRMQRSPGGVAVVCGDVRWSFAELDAYSNAVSTFLRGAGIGPEKVCAVLMERCPQMIATIVGIIRAGAGWLPLDPAHPLERLKFMVEDSRCSVVLGSGAEQVFSAPWVAIESLLANASQAEQEPWEVADPQALAYVNQGENAYNGRTLDETVVNPFLQSAEIPASRGPFLSVFRRSVAFVPETRAGLRDKLAFDAMLAFIDTLASADPDLARAALTHLLTGLLHLRDASNVALVHVQRLSQDQFESLLTDLLKVQSGGRMPVILAIAMFQTIKQAFGLDWQIEWQGINVADRASDTGGDITIQSDGATVLSVEVTERLIDRARVEATFNTKILTHHLTDYLFLYGDTPPEPVARELAKRYFGQGHEMNFLSVRAWLLHSLVTIGSRFRPDFMVRILTLLKERDIPTSLKRAWNDKVRAVLEG